MKPKTLNTLSFALCFSAVGVFAQNAEVTNAVPKSPPWDLSAAAGLTLTRGNSKTLLGTANLAGGKKWDEGKNELDLGVDGVYGENNSVKNAESLHGFGQYNRLFSDRAFGYLRLEGLHDAIADIDYRLMVDPGVGYYFIKGTNTTLRGEVGPGYLYEKDADNSTHSYITLRVAERFERKMNDHVKLWESVEILPQVDRFSNYIINAELGVESGMTKHLALQTYIQDSYHSEPAVGRLKNDIKLVAGIKYKF
jgi:putative salt-induced outer membrane protein YdiY